MAQSVKILLVEDNAGDILLISEALKEGKIANELIIIKDGWDAICYLERSEGFENAEQPDLIILDVNLPKLNGHEVLVRIKNNEDTKHIPVIMLTTSSSEKDIFQSYQNHANCYITKPVDVNEFLNVITTIEDFWISIVKLPKMFEN
jgi:CheY-like chemotaxis protein